MAHVFFLVERFVEMDAHLCAELGLRFGKIVLI